MKFKTSITKTFTFDSGHRLSYYNGACYKLHGHTYKLAVTVSGPVDELGMVLDFKLLKSIFKTKIKPKFDHKTLLYKDDELNKTVVKAFPKKDEWIAWLDYNPTAENIAADILEILSREINIPNVKVEKVKLWETPTSYAEVSPN